MPAITRRECISFLLALLFTLPLLGQRTEGMASYYADRFHARPTSTGEKYDKTAMTAASKDYPYGTILDVTSVASGKTVRVRVNDCGPHHPDRIIDLSRAAASDIGVLRAGSAMVRLTVVQLGDQGPTCHRSAWAKARKKADAERTATPAAPPEPTVQAKGPATEPEDFPTDVMLFGVQVGAYGEKDNAENMLKRLHDLGFHEVWTAKVGRVHRVFAGKYYFQDEAETLRVRLRSAGITDATVRRVQ